MLVAADGARVVAVSSRGICLSPVAFEDLHFEHRPHEPFAAYGQSRTTNALFAVEPDRRGRAEGCGPSPCTPAPSSTPGSPSTSPTT
ncbi:hypothetical protein ACWD5Q_05575 [Streptomyces sp. NPDC002513]